MKKAIENVEKCGKFKCDKLVIVNIIAAIILIAVFFYFMSGKQTVEKAPVTSTDCDDIVNPYMKDACYFNLAMRSEVHTDCIKIADIDQKDLCYMKIALAKNDKTICELVADKYYTRPKCNAEIDNLKTGQMK